MEFVSINIILNFVFIISLGLISVSNALTCNYCYQANLQEDCFINNIECEPNHVCSVETNLVTYYDVNDMERSYFIYRMGCEHYSMCRDKRVNGPGPYGYAITTTHCCCSDLCLVADGVGQGEYERCHSLWSNYTMTSEGSGICSITVRTWFICLYLMFVLFCCGNM